MRSPSTSPLRWSVAPGADKFLPRELLEDPLAFLADARGQEVLKDSSVRKVSIVQAPHRALFVKHYKVRSFKERCKHLFIPSKGKREWTMLRFARARGIPAPAPLAMTEKRHRGSLEHAVLVVEVLSDVQPLIEIPDGEKKLQAVRAVAPLVRRMHDAGLWHRDLHAGNILVHESGALYVVDLHAARRIRRLSLRRRLKNLALLSYSLGRTMTPAVREEMVGLYEGDHALFLDDKGHVVQKLERLEQRVHRRHMRSRTKRCLKNSGRFYTEGDGQWRLWARRGWTWEQLERIIHDHKDAVAGSRQGLVKSDRRTSITMVDAGAKRICVKEYRYPTFRLRLKECARRSKGKKGWIMANGLMVRGVTAMPPIALLERRTWGLPCEAFLLVESPPEYLELDRYIVQKFEDQEQCSQGRLRNFAESVATFMARLYHEDIAHRDLKTCNVMVKEQGAGWQFGLIDMDDLQIDRKISRKRLVRELVQLNTSTPLCIDGHERMAFLRRFLTTTGEDDAGAVAADVVKKSKNRRLVYVSPRGDVIREMDWEKWCSAGGRTRAEELG